MSKTAAEESQVQDRIRLIHADLDSWQPPPGGFDCACCFNFLDRRLWPALRLAVRPGGLLVMQTFHKDALQPRPQATPDYLLEPGELMELVQDWGWILVDSRKLTNGKTSEAVLAQRPD
jgi:tellurite methyltransferase